MHLTLVPLGRPGATTTEYFKQNKKIPMETKFHYNNLGPLFTCPFRCCILFILQRKDRTIVSHVHNKRSHHTRIWWMC